MLLIALVGDVVQILTLLLIVRAILSWVPAVDFGHPVVQTLMRVTDPVLLPVRRLLPPLGGLDLSPIVAILLLQLAGQLAIGMLRSLLAGA